MSSAESDRDVQSALGRYTRIDSDPWGVRIQASVVTWPTAGRPETRWVTVGLLAPDASDATIDRTRRRVLRDQRLFRVCSTCGSYAPVGLVDAAGVCAACVEKSRTTADSE